MSVKINVGGVWKDVPSDQPWINVNDVWKKVHQVWINVSNVWKMCYYYAMAGIDWTYQDALNRFYGAWISTDQVYAIVWTGVYFIASGTGAKTSYSTDGITWTPSTTLRGTAWGTVSVVYAMKWNGSIIMAVGGGGRVATSPDGLTWTYKNALVMLSGWAAADAFAVDYSPENNMWLVGGSAGKFAWSTNDGDSWTYESTPSGNINWNITACRAIFWTGDRFMVGGDIGRIMWYKPVAPGFGWSFLLTLSYAIYGFAKFNGGTIVACAASGRIFTAPASNPITWTVQTGLYLGTWGATRNVKAITTCDGTLAVVCGGLGQIAYSSDGVTWYYVAAGATAWANSNEAISICWKTNNMIVVGGYVKVMTSPDFWTWTNRLANFTTASTTTWANSTVYCMCWTGTYFICGGASAKIGRSIDGVTWTILAMLGSTTFGADNSVLCIEYLNGYIVVGGTNAKLAFCSNGLADTWSVSTLTGWTATNDVNALAWNGTYVAVGANGSCATSPNLVTWTYNNTLAGTVFGTTNAVNAIVWTGVNFVVTGMNARAAYSPTGTTWTGTTASLGAAIGTTNQGYRLAYIPSLTRVVCLANNGKVAISDNHGVSWYDAGASLSSTAWGTTAAGLELIWTGDQLVALGVSGKCATSPDGISWTYQIKLSQTLWQTQSGNSGAANANKIVVGGTQGMIATSP